MLSSLSFASSELEPGHPASDYSCPHSAFAQAPVSTRFRRGKSARPGKFWYQLNSQKTCLGDNITDGADDAMMNAIRRDELPSMYFMHPPSLHYGPVR